MGIKVACHPAQDATDNDYGFLSLCHRGDAFWWLSSGDRTIRSSTGTVIPYPDDVNPSHLYPLAEGRGAFLQEDLSNLRLGDLASPTSAQDLGWVNSSYIQVSPSGRWLVFTPRVLGEPELRRVASTQTGRTQLEFPAGIHTWFSPGETWIADWGWKSVNQQSLGGTLHLGHLDEGTLVAVDVPGASRPELTFLNENLVALQARDGRVRILELPSGKQRGESAPLTQEYLSGGALDTLLTETMDTFRVRCANTFQTLGEFPSGQVKGLSAQGWIAIHGCGESGHEFQLRSLPHGRLDYRQMVREEPSARSKLELRVA